ncbi:transposase [Vibrio sp. Isolate30]|jgi:transposase-like protein|uniref:transposase n=1 Tax=Vibrio sp. Isolate30 TaxID=2908536 RepID=UPI001EFD0ABF|nr:transposase [Vibrio sp. Isolate30]MCG9629818.1 transposase [Vibrio sp. Isolate30]
MSYFKPNRGKTKIRCRKQIDGRCCNQRALRYDVLEERLIQALPRLDYARPTVLVKLIVETALNDELGKHLGYEKHSPKPRSRNEYARKLIVIDGGEVPIDVPGDRETSFEPKLVC